MNTDEIIQELNSLKINEDIKKNLIEKITKDGLTEDVKSQIKAALQEEIDNIDNDSRVLKEMIEMVEKTNSEIDSAVKDANKQIDEVVEEESAGLDDLEKKADDLQASAQNLDSQSTDQQIEDVRQNIGGQ